jgi:dolichyl-phosphate beta-glucosyltransferase
LKNPYLSIVIPAYNEANRLPQTLTKVLSFLEEQSYKSEVIVVENGSEDDTLEVARAFEKKSPKLRVLHENKRGKGNAVRSGMLIARGEYKFMADADLSMPIEEIHRFLPPVLSDYDVAIGSREAEGAVRYDEPAYRHAGGRLINLSIRLLALPGLQDTQCGFKCFRNPAAEDLFRNQTMTGWSFDIELLYIARLRGYRIIEVPIPWYFTPESKVQPVKDALRMIRDLLKIRQNARRGMYAYQHERSASQAHSQS